MNKVFGRVVVRGSGVGVPNLLVTVYDVASSGSVSSRKGTKPRAATDESQWTSWGSVITGGGGTFLLTHGDGRSSAVQSRSTTDLVLIVTAADIADISGPESSARLATSFRRRAGEVESFLVTLDEAQLAGAGVKVPKPEDDVDDVISRQQATTERGARLRVESQKAVGAAIRKRLDLHRKVQPKFQHFLSAISVAPTGRPRVPKNARHVSPGTSVLDANRSVIQSAIENRITTAAPIGHVVLPEEQAARLLDAKGNSKAPVAASALEPYLRPTWRPAGPGLHRSMPPGHVCHEGPVDPCVDILEGEEAAEIPVVPPPPASGPDGSGAGPTDVPAVIQTLFQDLTPPEDATIFTASARAGVNEIQAGVRGFALESGPADAPSFHDFHHLQIAFEHVWQELFDDGLVHHGTELYAQLVELGFDPNEYLSDSNGTGLPGLIEAVTLHAATATPPVPFSVLEVFDITPENWASLAAYQGELQKIAEAVLDVERGKLTSEGTTGLTEEAYRPGNEHWREYYYEHIAKLRREGDRIIDHARRNLTSAQRYDQFHQILADLQKSLREPYRFSIYAADGSGRSVNFGMVATYRQKWEPVSYQVGELVKTVALAPKEVRRYSKKQAIRKSRAEKEVENSLQSRKTDSTETTRSEKEIVQKALNKTNFQLTAEGGIDVGIANAKGTTALTLDAAAESQEVKFEFREAVRKAAEEYKLERALEINVGSGEDLSAEESGEISNPNDEISVTYLFYQLQRRYRVSEEIHRVTPVILVAQEFPKPSEIDEDWILAHDWILRRVLLDDSFVPAMNYLATKVVGDEVSLQEMYLNLQQERRIAEELKEELVRTRAQLSGRYAALESSIKKRADALEGDDSGVPVPMPVGFLFAGSDASPEAAQVREDAARDAYERAARKEKEVLDRLERETTSLTTLTETYTKTLSEHLNQKAQIARLRVHIKANIMYYMQAIWTHEPPDQRFFRLHEVQVPKLSGKTTYKIESDPDALAMPPDWKKPHRIVAKCELVADLEYETLEEVADLDNLLGCKGNYMMFPLRKTNVLTEFMMVPYFDAVMGLRDPDPLGGWTVADFVKYVCCLDHTLSAAEFAKLLPGLMEAYRRLVNAPGTGGEEIIVPTDSLFIEALPGAHPILEDFKLFHRAVDVKKVQAEVRAAELENLRAAARLLAGEREDPNIEKKVIIEGGTGVIVAPDDN